MAADLLEGQPQVPAFPNTGPTLELPSKAKLPSNPFTPREDLVNALINQESGGKAGARGKVGEVGLMQIRPETAAMYGVRAEQLANPEINRQTGTRYLSDLLKRYKGNEFLALVAYNSGPGPVDRGHLLPQSVKYATRILNKASSGNKTVQGGVPVMMSQRAMEPPQKRQPSSLSRIGSSLAGALEGTAYAQEFPPLPSGIRVTQGAPPSSGAPAPSAAQEFPPLPQGMPALPSGMRPRFDPSRFKMSMSVGPSGPRIGLVEVQPPANVRTQESAANVVLGQVDDAISFYDKNLKPRESEFTGNILTPGGRNALAQPFESSRSLWAQAIGMGGEGGQADPQVQQFYDKAGPLLAEQLRALVGGRLAQGMIDGPLAPHLPNQARDSLPRMRAKLDDLKVNVPIVLNNIEKMRSQGMSDDQILNSWQGGASSPEAPTAESEAPQLPPGFVLDK